MKKGFLLFTGLFLTTAISYGQAITENYNIVSSSVPFLTISPDSKAAAMGDAGVASTPDANSIYWNTAKLAFIDQDAGANFSYAPWLRDIIDGMGLMNVSGFKKVGEGQYVTAALTYFNQGQIDFTTNTGADAGSFQSREMALTAGYSIKLGQDISGGVNIKYINSNLTGNQVLNGQASKPGTSVAGDLSVYYHKQRPTDEFRKTDFALGLALQNIGGKINYGSERSYYIPANMKLGASFSVIPDPQNRFNFLFDINKLMVPTPSADNVLPDYGALESIFKSFGDAPNGISEELAEINSSLGAEYLYEDLLAIRAGYYFQPTSKGGLSYATMGIGVKLREIYGIDLAYLIPTTSTNPLANTFRVSVNFYLNGKSKEALRNE